ncbi:hypothetical protein CJ030_MR5G022579 [Morella rubra]|uniref:Uncharacterized protein n=1 Tax=Morella rubra TaxID=262757 RepID=A0A6A1VI83_9ROSI|nr:hypothetical protein CJ030_MR5G022579 [Morella rubra]
MGVRHLGRLFLAKLWSEVPLKYVRFTSYIWGGNFPLCNFRDWPAELYAASHKRKNGDWLSDVAKDNHEKMRELQEQAILDGRSYTDIDILHQVLGPKPGYVRGLGRAVKPPRTSVHHPPV